MAKGLTLRQLIKSTPSNIQYLSRDTRVKKVKKQYDKKTNRARLLAQVYSVPDTGTGRIHTCSITIKGMKNKFSDIKVPVVVSCNCENYMFTWEVANNKKGSSEIEFSNGELPLMTNPSLVPGLCRHLVCLGNRIINKGL